jgi:hypothetical protein
MAVQAITHPETTYTPPNSKIYAARPRAHQQRRPPVPAGRALIM